MALLLRSTLLAALFVLPAYGTEIESKDGRSFEGEILNADAFSVKVKRQDTGKTFSLKRETLSIETNDFINGFLKEKRDAEEAKKGKRTSFEVVTEDKMRLRVSIRLPNPNVPIAPSNAHVVISGEGESLGNCLEISFWRKWTIERAEEYVNQQKRAIASSVSTKKDITAEDLKYAAELFNVKRCRYGEWEGFVIGDWTDAQLQSDKRILRFAHYNRYGQFVRGDFTLKVTISAEPTGKFRLDQLPDIIESIQIEVLEAAPQK